MIYKLLNQCRWWYSRKNSLYYYFYILDLRFSGIIKNSDFFKIRKLMKLMGKKCKVSYRKIWRSYIVYKKIRLLNCILRQRDRGSRCRREERPGRVQSVVFVLEFLRFTDVQSGKAFEIWNECAQIFIPAKQGSHNRGGDAWSWTFKAIAWKKNMRHLGIINFYSRDYASRVGASFLFCTIIFHWKECNFI